MREEFVFTVLAPIGRDESLIPIPHVGVDIWEVQPNGSLGNQAVAFENRVNDIPAQSMETDQSGVIRLWFDPGDYQINFSDQNLRPRIKDFFVDFTSSPWANRGSGGGGGGGGVVVTVTNPGDQTNGIGDAISLQIAAGDSDGTFPSFVASGLPSGLSISTTGLITGTTVSDETRTVTITAIAPSTGDTGSAVFGWTVGSGGGGGGGGGGGDFGGDGVFGGDGNFGA